MALYHTHRPQTFDAVIGQEHIIQTLQNQITNNSVAHAYLFSGPRGVGKTTTARVLAKAVNCTKKKEGAAAVCNTCDACTSISAGRSIDVIEIDAASHTGVDSVRENIIENAQFKPTTFTRKVFIIDEVHMLSTSAFNALLKTLEEPPAHVMFILATTELHKLPATIISRCQRFHFKKVGYKPMKKHLEAVAKKESVHIDTDVLDRVINKSDGCVRDAVSLLDQIMATGEKKITAEIASLVLPTTNIEQVLSFVRACIEKNTASGIETVNQVVSDGGSLSQFAHDALELLRTMMIYKANPSADAGGLDISTDAKKELQALSKNISQAELVQLTDIILTRRAGIKTAPLPQLPLEMAIVQWCAGDEKVKNDTPIDTKPADTKKKTEKIVQKEETEKKVVEPTVVEEKPKAEATTTECTLDQAKQYWKHCAQAIAESSPSISFVLNAAKVESVSNETVTVAVPFAFHKEKLETQENKQRIESTLSEHAGYSLAVAFTVQEQATAVADSGDLQELAAAFGGEVVS